MLFVKPPPLHLPCPQRRHTSSSELSRAPFICLDCGFGSETASTDITEGCKTVLEMWLQGLPQPPGLLLPITGHHLHKGHMEPTRSQVTPKFSLE